MWVVVALCVLVALIALTLCIPVDLGLKVEAHGRLTAGFTVEWLFGRVSKRFRTGAPAEGRPVAQRSRRARAKKRRSRRDAARLVLELIRTPGLRGALERLVRRTARCFRLRQLDADFRACLDDPADTVFVIGAVAHAALAVSVWSGRSLRITPVFEDRLLLEGEGNARARVFPIRLVPPLVAFLLSPPAVRVAVRLLRWRLRRR